MLPAESALTPVQAIVLGCVQGLTELLPVSSSAHLYVVPTLLGWKYEGLAFDVALHAGTLLALVAAFWQDWWTMLRDALTGAPAAARDARALLLRLAAASVPAAVVGMLLGDAAETVLRSMPLQAAMLLVFGALLWWADRAGGPGREDRLPAWRTSMLIGLAQCLALVPGVSRSGITMTAGRTLGLSRVSAARFSFLLATPITFGAVLLKLPDVPRDLPLGVLSLAVVSAALSGVLAIRWLMGLLRHAGFGAFFAYRAILALAIVAWLVIGRAG